MSKIRPFINQYNQKGVQFPSHQEEWKKFEQNNKTIALNILFLPHNTKTIRLEYKSNYNSQQRESQVVLLMITDGEKWHYLAVKSLSTLFRGITSSRDGDFYCLNCFHSYRTNNALKKHERLCNNHDYCHVEILKEDEKNIKIQPQRKIIKSSIYNYFSFRMFPEKEQSCQNNSQKSYTQRKAKHKPSGCVHLIMKKIDLIITEEQIVLNSGVKK